MKKIGYKKVFQIVNCEPVVRILKLEILGQVITPFGVSKKRTNKVRVLEAFSTRKQSCDWIRKPIRIDKRLKTKGPYIPYHFKSSYVSPGFQYFVGKVAVSTDNLNKDKYEMCGSGINYFSTLKEALAYDS